MSNIISLAEIFIKQRLSEDFSDGHDFEQISVALDNAGKTKGVPTAIVMKTVKGKGVSYMEDNAGWHGKAPNDEEYEIAKNELGKQLAELEAM